MPWNKLKIHTKINIATPATNPPKVHPRIVSFKSMWKKFVIAQKPESFGSESPIPPAHTAIAHRIGDTPELIEAVATIAAVVVSAVVVEPVAQRKTWEITKHIISTGILKPIKVPVITSAIPQAFKIHWR